ncbi:MAG: hypothetical protein ABIJ21_03660 [Nanoarchaeota archaeon]
MNESQENISTYLSDAVIPGGLIKVISGAAFIETARLGGYVYLAYLVGTSIVHYL